MDVRRDGFLDERLVRSDACIVAVGSYACDPDRDPAAGCERDGGTAVAMVDERVVLSIFM